jgi:ribosomal protein S18 acetylase RimI-like enzyme
MKLHNAATIRPATEADVPAVHHLLVRTWHATFDAIYGPEKVSEVTAQWHSPDRIRASLAQPGVIRMVAEQGGEITGTATGFATPSGGIKLQQLYILPDRQRSGLGTALLDAFRMSFIDPRFIELEVAEPNVDATAFYVRSGFELKSTVPNTFSGGLMHVMRKELGPDGVTVAPLIVRLVRDSDAQDLIGLITLCFAEYPGCYFDPHGDMPDIVRPAQSRLATEGRFLAVEDASGRICACVGIDFPEPGAAELHRLYVRPDMRGRGLAKELTCRMEEAARERGAARMIMWSDTRFTKAHALYKGLGYTRGDATRSLGDISLSREFRFERAL